MLDICMRDFSLANVTNPIMFRYTPAGQGGSQQDSSEVQERLVAFMKDMDISFKKSDLLNDGGNFVDDYAGNVVISKKFLRDNNLSEREGRQTIKLINGVKNVAFIEADEQGGLEHGGLEHGGLEHGGLEQGGLEHGGLEHGDGVVSFVDTNTLIINSYPEDDVYAQELKRDLKRGLPNVKIHEIVTPYDGSVIYDERFGSACGLYTNALVTAKHIYFPQFGIKGDAIALKQIKAATTRIIIPVLASPVCHMGGGVRCMSWQLRGSSAMKLLNNIKNE